MRTSKLMTCLFVFALLGLSAAQTVSKQNLIDLDLFSPETPLTPKFQCLVNSMLRNRRSAGVFSSGIDQYRNLRGVYVSRNRRVLGHHEYSISTRTFKNGSWQRKFSESGKTYAVKIGKRTSGKRGFRIQIDSGKKKYSTVFGCRHNGKYTLKMRYGQKFYKQYRTKDGCKAHAFTIVDTVEDDDEETPRKVVVHKEVHTGCNGKTCTKTEVHQEEHTKGCSGKTCTKTEVHEEEHTKGCGKTTVTTHSSTTHKWSSQSWNTKKESGCTSEITTEEVETLRCPEGFTNYKNVKCVQNCPAGYKRAGLVCSKITVTTSSVVSCPPGYLLKNGVCSKKTVVVHTEVSTNCPKGTKLQGNKCVSIKCDTGYQLVNGACQEITCGDGQVKRGNVCFKITCGVNQKLIAGKCTTVKCASGYALKNGACFRLNCPAGYQLKGEECTKIPCPSGFHVVGLRCVERCSKSKGLVWNGKTCIYESCPSGFERMRIGRITSCVKSCSAGFTQKSDGSCVRVSCPKYFKLESGKCIRVACSAGYKLDGEKSFKIDRK